MYAKSTWLDRVGAFLLRQFFGRRVTRLTVRYAHRIYCGPGFQSQWRRLRFLLRTGWYGDTSCAWFAFLASTRWRREQVLLEPQLAERLHRPYRRSDWRPERRLSAAIAHWRHLEGCDWPPQATQVRRVPFELASIACKDGGALRVVLRAPEKYAKEGDACLQLLRGSEVLFSAAFSLAVTAEKEGAPAALAVDIGSLQGPCSPSGRNIVRDTTKLLHGLRPRELLLEALRAVGIASGARELIGVSNSRHIYRHWRSRRQFAFDYNAYWTEQKGIRRPDGDYTLSLAEPTLELDNTPSRKRAEATRRHSLRLGLRRQIVVALAPGKSFGAHEKLLSSATCGEGAWQPVRSA